MSAEETLRKEYLELMKRVLINEVYEAGEFFSRLPTGGMNRLLFSLIARPGEQLWSPRRISPQDRDDGRVWPPARLAHSMIGRKRLDNLQACVSSVIADNVPGDLIETGVWRGGAAIFMRAVLKAFGDDSRNVWAADSFQGLPEPSAEHPLDANDVHHTIPELAVSIEEVRDNFRRYGLLDERVKFLKGWFRDTLPQAPIDQLSVIRLDGDMYSSTIDAISALYPKLSSRGYVIVDDYCLPPCAQAIADYRKEHSIDESIVNIDGTGAFWRKH